MNRQRPALLVAGLLSACTVGKDYQRPDIETPTSWRLQSSEAGQISNVVWWEQFQDPVLTSLVHATLENTKDLDIATANVDQAFAQYGITRSALFQQIAASASKTRQRLSRDAPLAAPPAP